MNISVRKAVPEDWEAVDRMMRQVHDIHVIGRPDAFVPEAYMNREEFLTQAEGENSFILAADYEGQAVGICCGFVKEPSANPRMKPVRHIYIDTLVVDEAFRGHGAGRALHEAVVHKAKEMGVNSVRLTVWQFNQEAIGFYEAAGFKERMLTMELDI